MAKKTAETLSSGVGGIGKALEPVTDIFTGGGGKKAAAAQKEQDERYKDAFEQAQNLQTKTEVDNRSSTDVATTNTSTTGTTFSKAGKTEKELQAASIANFKKQQSLVNDAQAQIKNNQKLENSAQGTVGNILGGDAFNLNASEQQRIDALRDTNIAAGTSSVNKLLDERLAAAQADAARRGIRGQAAAQIQGSALTAATESLDRNTLEANRIAAEQAIALPGQRVQTQAGTATQFADFADQARQQAIQNRADLQDPVALQQLRDERLASGKTTTSGSTTSATDSREVGKSLGQGQGAAEILAAQAGAPGAKAAENAGNQQAFNNALGVGGVAAGFSLNETDPNAMASARLAAKPAGGAAPPNAAAANNRLQSAGLNAAAAKKPTVRPLPKKNVTTVRPTKR